MIIKKQFKYLHETFRFTYYRYCRLWEVVDLVKYSAGSAEGKSVSTSNRCAGERQGILRFAQRKARYKKIGFGRRACVVFMHRVFIVFWSVVESLALASKQASSAKSFVKRFEQFDKSFMKSKKANGPMTEPWTIPQWMGNIGDL
uniref:uncharacterized protein LOC120347251 n=1 Tax=Styela clava TaxID=7725 RepID=UPI00193A120C|nr:uncharacterized protein LOC120347251 [Styela clava]XP_039273095.1 uncharacterized protein LOC120347251 [Styela clava]